MEETREGKAFPRSRQRRFMLVQNSTLEPMKYPIPEHMDILSKELGPVKSTHWSSFILKTPASMKYPNTSGLFSRIVMHETP